MRWLFVVLALAGCDKVLGLKEHDPIDAPADGHDEDLDGVGDRTDTCPTMKGSQQDTDMDGVGDLCDPDADIENHIAALYTFDAAPPEWVAVSGSWNFMNDQLVHTGSTTFSRFVAKNGLILTPPYVIESRFRFDTAPPNGEFSLSAALDANAQGSFCTIINGLMTEVHAYSPGDSGVTRVPPLDFTATFTARMIVASNKITCNITSSIDGQIAASNTNPDPVRMGPMGLEGRYANTTIDYVIIYTR